MGMLDNLLGQAGGEIGTLREFAKHANLPVGEAGGALAKMLPELVNQFTPKGELPQSASLESALGSLLKSVMR